MLEENSPDGKRKFLTTDRDLSEFIRSVLYKDFCSVAKDRIEAIKDDLCVASDMNKVARLQGELVGVEFWLHFPEQILLAHIEEENKDVATPSED